MLGVVVGFVTEILRPLILLVTPTLVTVPVPEGTAQVPSFFKNEPVGADVAIGTEPAVEPEN